MYKNILCTIDTTGPGGAETVFLELVKNLDRGKYNPYIIIKDKGWIYDEVLKIGLYPEIIKMEGSFNIKYLFKLIKFIRRNKIDLIHSHLLGSNVYCSIAGIFCRVPVISTFHGTVDSNLNDRMLSIKFSLINRGSKYIVFVSNHLKNYYLSFTSLCKAKSVTVYNGVNTERFLIPKTNGVRKELGFSNNDILIGSIGNIRDSKGYDILLKAASIAIKKIPKCKFIIAGEGHGRLYHDILILKKSLGLESYVKFLGFRPDIENILSGIDLFVLPSTTEGFSISTIEAMAAGKPVIVTNSGGPREIVTHLTDGIIVEPNNPEAIAQAIKQCVDNYRLRYTLALNSRKTVLKFSTESMIKRYSELYSTCFSN
jgi:glycosyltransferase involved in cell wall biosynthesis